MLPYTDNSKRQLRLGNIRASSSKPGGSRDVGLQLRLGLLGVLERIHGSSDAGVVHGWRQGICGT